LFRVSFPAVSFAQQDVAFRENVMVLSQLARVDVDARFSDESGKRVMSESAWLRPGTEAPQRGCRCQLARVGVMRASATNQKNE